MTQQDDITQPVLTEPGIQALWNEACKDSPKNPGWKRHIRFARAIEQALSKLHTPVADSTLPLEKALHELVSKIAPGLDTGDLLQDAQRASAMLDAIQASAPVAGEAKNYPGDNVAERLDKMADGQPPGSQAQSDLYAAATIWRKHIAHRAAPQASAVAGEAVTWEAVRQELAIFLMGATGRSSKEWHRPLDNASEGGALARMRACLAAPRASAEDVRNAALEQAAVLVGGHTWAGASKIVSELIAEHIRALKPQADKDGGQQRAGDVRDTALSNLIWAASERDKGNRIRQFDQLMDEARAAISSNAAKQGSCDE